MGVGSGGDRKSVELRITRPEFTSLTPPGHVILSDSHHHHHYPRHNKL